MARKDEMLKAFLCNKEFCNKYEIEKNSITTVYQAKGSQLPVLVVLGSIIEKYEEDNTTPLYQQVINLLNKKS
jgi:hypothetical protein